MPRFGYVTHNSPISNLLASPFLEPCAPFESTRLDFALSTFLLSIHHHLVWTCMLQHRRRALSLELVLLPAARCPPGAPHLAAARLTLHNAGRSININPLSLHVPMCGKYIHTILQLGRLGNIIR